MGALAAVDRSPLRHEPGRGRRRRAPHHSVRRRGHTRPADRTGTGAAAEFALLHFSSPRDPAAFLRTRVYRPEPLVRLEGYQALIRWRKENEITGKRKGRNPGLASTYRALAEHRKRQAYPKAAEAAQVAFAALWTG
ncbi:hypothetical protein [Streptomyces lavendulocolor]|uniref:hypothetical protein n=1 Tax=Streptomyces lavendulocolor TaxID=67316 RepID=UPI003CD081FC